MDQGTQNGETEPSETLKGAEHEQAYTSVQNKPKDFWCLGPGKQVRRIHVVPRTRRFVPIGVTDCPVSIKCLSACRELE